MTELMSAVKVNGTVFEQMLRSAVRGLRAQEDTLNRLNVFPVPDGDTGTNMRVTLDGGVRAAQPTADLGGYLKQVSRGMLYAARGNSGVILSQLFKGVYQTLADKAEAATADLAEAFIGAYRSGYRSVIDPVEGTILTVAREGIERTRASLTPEMTVEQFLTVLVREMNETLRHTPEMLPVLREMNVLDSGGMGFIVVVEGMARYLRGEDEGEPVYYEDYRPEEAGHFARGAAEPAGGRTDSFTETSPFVDGYCTEFILQRMALSGYDQAFELRRFIDELKRHGDSLVCFEDDTRVKVHIHTKKPGEVIAAAQRYGEFVTFKMDNMQVQHNEQIRTAAKTEKVPLAVIAVTNGPGIREDFLRHGCTVVLNGGRTMNTSAEEFVGAIQSVNADHVVIFPNSRNVVPAAEQARLLCDDPEKVTVIPSESIGQTSYALAMDIPTDPVEDRIRAMRETIGAATEADVVTAAREWHHGELSCAAGDTVVYVNGEPVRTGGDWLETLIGALGQLDGMEDFSGCVVFRGENVPAEREAPLAERLSAAFPDLEVQIQDGGQAINDWILCLI